MKQEDNGLIEQEVKFKSPSKFLKKFDKFWIENGYTTRSEALRDGMRRMMMPK